MSNEGLPCKLSKNDTNHHIELTIFQSRLDVIELNRSKTSDSERRIGIASIALVILSITTKLCDRRSM